MSKGPGAGDANSGANSQAVNGVNGEGEIERKRQEVNDYLRDRLWIGQNGEINCSLHGGNYLRDQVLIWPQRMRHVTPLNIWLDITNRPDYIFPCEVCMEEATVYETE